MNHPDAAKHLKISLVKSAFRIAAGAALIPMGILPFQLCGFFLIAAEILGIVEELV